MLEDPVPVKETTASTSTAATDGAAKRKRKAKSGGPPTFPEVSMALEAAMAALRRLRYNFCLMGSAACVLYGMNHRVPHDLDIIVLETKDDVELIKAAMVRADRRFFTIAARNPENKWNVLWFRLPVKDPSDKRRTIKVDILSPGVLNIPPIPASAVQVRSEVPVAPFLCLLLLKLQGYFDHLESEQKRMRDKIPVDVEDVQNMARLGADMHRAHVSDLERRWYGEAFKELGLRRVNEFVKVVPGSASHWKVMGFVVTDPAHDDVGVFVPKPSTPSASSSSSTPPNNGVGVLVPIQPATPSGSRINQSVPVAEVVSLANGPVPSSRVAIARAKDISTPATQHDLSQAMRDMSIRPLRSSSSAPPTSSNSSFTSARHHTTSQSSSSSGFADDSSSDILEDVKSHLSTLAKPMEIEVKKRREAHGQTTPEWPLLSSPPARGQLHMVETSSGHRVPVHLPPVELKRLQQQPVYERVQVSTASRPAKGTANWHPGLTGGVPLGLPLPSTLAPTQHMYAPLQPPPYMPLQQIWPWWEHPPAQDHRQSWPTQRRQSMPLPTMDMWAGLGASQNQQYQAPGEREARRDSRERWTAPRVKVPIVGGSGRAPVFRDP